MPWASASQPRSGRIAAPKRPVPGGPERSPAARSGPAGPPSGEWLRIAARVLRRKCASCGGPLEEERAPAAPPVIRRCAACERALSGGKPPPGGCTCDTGRAATLVSETLRGGGRPLDPATRAFFEAGFAYDLRAVQVHDGPRADRSARAVNALAYTVGSDIAFRSGYFAPGTSAGRRLLAHELAHVVQQGRGGGAQLSARLDGPLEVGRADDPLEREADRIADRVLRMPSGGGIDPISGTPVHLQRQRHPGESAGPRRGRGRPVVSVVVDTAPASIDSSLGVDAITDRFYHIPAELLPPDASVPAGPILTVGRYGCALRRYGLTVDDLDVTLSLDDADIATTQRAWNMVQGSPLATAECWTNHVRFRVRLRQRILLPNDLATHPCTRGSNPAQQRQEILAHERLHEADNLRAAREVRDFIRERLAFTSGVGRLMADVRVTSDAAAFIRECGTRLRERLERIRGDSEIEYHRRAAEYAGVLDPHDAEFHALRQRLLEAARRRAAAR